MRDIAREVLDLVGVGVRRRHLDGRRQVQDDFSFIVGLPYVHDAIAHLNGVVGGRLGEDLWAVLVADGRVGQVLLDGVDHPSGALLGQVDGALLGGVEDDAAEQLGRRVVHVDGGALGADQRLHRAIDQVLTGLRQHRDHHVIGNRLGVLDERADEVPFGL